MDLASLNLAIWYSAQGPSFRIAIGAVWPTARRAQRAEALLAGSTPSAALLEEAIEAILEEAQPREGSLRATPDYKKALIRSFIEQGFEELTGGEHV
jgi:CO/xanthine dehydrogenase FAD-binding subunit